MSTCSIINLRKTSKSLKSCTLSGLKFEAIENSPLTANQFEKWFLEAWYSKDLMEIFLSDLRKPDKSVAREISFPRRLRNIKSPKPKLLTIKSSRSWSNVGDFL